MNELEQLKQQLEEISKKIAELEKPKKEIWEPEIGECYWYIAGIGSAADACDDEDDFDNAVFACGNFYKTEAEAEYQAKVQKYTNLFRKYVEEHSEPLDWGCDDKCKYYLYYDYANNHICFGFAFHHKEQGTIYASSEEVLEEAISFVGKENVIKYVLGVK